MPGYSTSYTLAAFGQTSADLICGGPPLTTPVTDPFGGTLASAAAEGTGTGDIQYTHAFPMAVNIKRVVLNVNGLAGAASPTPHSFIVRVTRYIRPGFATFAAAGPGSYIFVSDHTIPAGLTHGDVVELALDNGHGVDLNPAEALALWCLASTGSASVFSMTAHVIFGTREAYSASWSKHIGGKQPKPVQGGIGSIYNA